jgi:hypothetical protein
MAGTGNKRIMAGTGNKIWKHEKDGKTTELFMYSLYLLPV